MTQGQRVRELRKSKGMTLEEFGKVLGVQKSAVSKIERGDRGLTEQMLISICREFDVREEWLREGKGDMFLPLSRDEEIERFIGDALKDEPDTFKKRLISALARLNEEDWNRLEEVLAEIVGAKKEG